MGKANKLLLPLGGRPVLEHAIRSLLPAVDAVVVVTGHDREPVEQIVQAVVEAVSPTAPVRTVHNDDHAEGMGRSLACGVAALDPVAGILVHLGDVPFVHPSTVRRLIETFAKQTEPAILFPVHDGRRGHPVLFDAAFREALTQCSGDVGAKPLVQSHPEAVVEVSVDDPGVHRDVDTRDAYEQMRERKTMEDDGRP